MDKIEIFFYFLKYQIAETKLLFFNSTRLIVDYYHKKTQNQTTINKDLSMFLSETTKHYQFTYVVQYIYIGMFIQYL